MRSMLAKLQEFGIQANVDKCKFHIIETKYLSLIISKNGIKIDQIKIKAIKNENTLKCVKNIQVFIGFCFYCCFIKNFLKIPGLLNAMTKKDVAFTWPAECKKVF